MHDQRTNPDERSQRDLTSALSPLPAASHANRVVLELYSIGGLAVLDAVAQGISASPLGLAYLSVHLGGLRRDKADHSWRDRLRYWLTRVGANDLSIFPHSGAMTALRFMLVLEGFANLVDGTVTIDPVFANALRLAQAAA